MRIPRDISGEELAGLLQKLGYSLSIPKHKPLKVGTLNGILLDVAKHLKISKEELISRLWLTD